MEKKHLYLLKDNEKKGIFGYDRYEEALRTTIKLRVVLTMDGRDCGAGSCTEFLHCIRYVLHNLIFYIIFTLTLITLTLGGSMVRLK